MDWFGYAVYFHISLINIVEWCSSKYFQTTKELTVGMIFISLFILCAKALSVQLFVAQQQKVLNWVHIVQ